MAEARPSGVRDHRRWAFDGCVFDEANWSLTVNGARVSIESKPLKVLRELLLRPHEVVSKEQLLDAIWPDVTVVEASLTTAVRKLRIALGQGNNRPEFIETVPGIGYRFAGDAVVSETGPGSLAAPVPTRASSSRWAPIGVVGALALILGAAMLVPKAAKAPPAASSAPRTYSDAEIMNTLRHLDIDAVERMIAAGWDAKTLLGGEKNDSLNYVLGICEWNAGHDRQKLLLMARTLVENGVRVDRRNVWGDTAYSIAKAPRYCGPDHPVTQMIRRMCSEGPKPLGDRCMASYELARGQHFQPEPQYKRQVR